MNSALAQKPSPKGTGRLRRSVGGFFFGHLPTKMTALVIAILLYASLYGKANITRPEDLTVVTGDPPGERQIRIRAGLNGLVRLDGDVRVPITVSGLKSEVESFLGRALTGEVVLDRFVPAPGQEAKRAAVQPVDVTFKNRPPGLTIVFPEGLPTVSVSRKDEWYATLRVDQSTIQVSDGYEVRSASVDPEQVRVIGPTELKPQLKEIVIGEGVLQQKSGERSYDHSVVKSQLISLIGQPNVDLDLAQRVTVSVVIGPRSVTKDINLPHGIIVSITVEEVPGEPRPIFQSGLDLKLDVAGTQLVPEQPVRVTLTGPQAAVESVERDPDRYRVLFDLTGILSRRDSRIFTIEGKIPNLPQGVRHEPIRGTIIRGE